MTPALFGAVLLLLVAPLHAAFEERPASPRAAALCGAMSAGAEGVDALWYNPAALGWVDRPEARAGYGRLLGLPELGWSAVQLGGPWPRVGAWGAAHSRFGSSFYMEEETLLAQAFRVKDAAFGLALKRDAVRITRYGSAEAWGLDAGFAGSFRPGWRVGFSFRNLNRPRLGGWGQGPAQELRAGLRRGPIAGFQAAWDLVKPWRGRPSHRAALEWSWGKVLSLRCGVQTRPSRYGVGFSFGSPSLRMDYAHVAHPDFGDEHHTGVSWRWGRPPR